MFAVEKLAIVFLTLYFITQYFGNKYTLPILKLISHWCRWLCFAGFFTYFLVVFELSFRPDWVHWITGMAVWFFLETLFFRVSVQLLNLSEIPLFPKYQRDTIDNLWPINQRALKIKDYLIHKSFKNVGVIKANLSQNLSIRQALFLDDSERIRINVVFLPNAKQEIICYVSLFSLNESGLYLITDNQNVPFGGFYPEHWSVNRYPLCDSLPKLLKKHRAMMKTKHTNWQLLETDLLQTMNQCQAELEVINEKMGFFNHSSDSAKSQISSEGSHRICIEMWLLSYFGKTFS